MSTHISYSRGEGRIQSGAQCSSAGGGEPACNLQLNNGSRKRLTEINSHCRLSNDRDEARQDVFDYIELVFQNAGATSTTSYPRQTPKN